MISIGCHCGTYAHTPDTHYLYDSQRRPDLTPEMRQSGHQVWVWLAGAPEPHWEVRGTGARI